MAQYKVLIVYIISNGLSKNHLRMNWKNADWSDWEGKTSSHFP